MYRSDDDTHGKICVDCSPAQSGLQQGPPGTKLQTFGETNKDAWQRNSIFENQAKRWQLGRTASPAGTHLVTRRRVACDGAGLDNGIRVGPQACFRLKKEGVVPQGCRLSCNQCAR